MRKLKRFVLYWIHNSAFMYLATQVFPGKFVLGNARFTLVWACILSGLSLTVIFELANILISRFKKPKLNCTGRFGYYFAVNFVGLWIVARLAPFFGFGVVKFTWLIGLAFVLNIVQKVISKGFEVKKK